MRLPHGVVPEEPGPGQESVWDYPRPPAVVPDARRVVVRYGTTGDDEVCRTSRTYRVLETSHPPTFYLPLADFRPGTLRPAQGRSMCEWKGQASYFDVVATDGRVTALGAWTYREPRPGFEVLRDHVALYACAVDEVTLDGERVRPQPGEFYGGWVSDDVVGPFKGAPGSMGW